MLNWFNATEAQNFGASLAKRVISQFPADAPEAKGKKAAKKHDALFQRLTLEVTQFKQSNKLNIYKKAKLGNVFKWTLVDAGYDADFVDQLTHWLMLQL
jgi:hypothetical protein